MTREILSINNRESRIIFTGPALSFILINLNFINFPVFKNTSNWDWNLLILLFIIGLNVILLIALSFQRSSKYRTLGAIRTAAQGLAFDIRGLLLLTLLIILYKNLQLNNLIIFFTGFLWVQIIRGLTLIEIGRSPFDLPEGERELVSGFNTELRANLFILVFLREYGALLILSLLSRTLIFGGSYQGTCLFMFLFLFSRAAFPRIRLDQSIKLSYYKLTGVLILILRINWILHF